MKSGKYFFDFVNEKYVQIYEGYYQLFQEDIPIDREIELKPDYKVLGLIVLQQESCSDKMTKNSVEQLVYRQDGKKICNILKRQRIALAKANNIPFETVDCPFDAPCAGTCAKCDEEVAYLTKALEAIPEEDRIYPQFDPEWEMLL